MRGLISMNLSSILVAFAVLVVSAWMVFETSDGLADTLIHAHHPAAHAHM
jgi:hypothetical protein